MKNIDPSNIPDLSKAFEDTFKKPPNSVEIDFDRYQAILDDPDLSQDQQKQVIMALWSIITAFVQLGFGVHPVQQACGQLGTDHELTSILETTDIELNNVDNERKKHPHDRSRWEREAP